MTSTQASRRLLRKIPLTLVLLSFVIASPVVAQALIWQVSGTGTFGWATSGVGDIDADGHHDFIVGARTAGQAIVFSGATGIPIHTFNTPTPGDQFGYETQGVGDINSDGAPDLFIGAPEADPGGLGDAGSAYVFSGASAALIFEFHGTDPGGRFGHSVAGPGDTNGDGISDLLVGAPFTDVAAMLQAGQVFLFSGATGTLLLSLDGEDPGDWFGISVAGSGDIDGDFLGDFLVGARHADPGGLNDAGKAYAISGASGLSIHVLAGTSGGGWFGHDVSGPGDVDGDGIPDI